MFISRAKEPLSCYEPYRELSLAEVVCIQHNVPPARPMPREPEPLKPINWSGEAFFILFVSLAVAFLVYANAEKGGMIGLCAGACSAIVISFFMRRKAVKTHARECEKHAALKRVAEAYNKDRDKTTQGLLEQYPPASEAIAAISQQAWEESKTAKLHYRLNPKSDYQIQQSRNEGFVTKHEDKLFNAMSQLENMYIWRQVWNPAGYPADFVIVSRATGEQWIIEVDGHNTDDDEKDRSREAILNQEGFHVLRIKNNSVRADATWAAKRIQRIIEGLEEKEESLIDVL